MDSSTNNVRGAVRFNEDGGAVLHLLKGHDIDTVMWEFAIIFRRHLSTEELRIAEVALGIRDGIWQPEDEDRFANGFLQYLYEGVPPTEELRANFESYKKWLTEIYTPFEGSAIDIYVAPALKEMYKQMLGG